MGSVAIGRLIRGVFAPLIFFLFSRGAKIGEFRPTWSAQVVRGSPVKDCGWGEMVGISPRGRGKTLRVRSRSEEHRAKSGVRAQLLTDPQETAKVRKTPPRGFAHLERFF
jgi:hypothetical protein